MLFSLFKNENAWGVPGSPVVRTLASTVVAGGLIPGQGAQSRDVHGQKTKTRKRSNIVTSSMDFKNSPHQKKSLKNENAYLHLPSL